MGTKKAALRVYGSLVEKVERRERGSVLPLLIIIAIVVLIFSGLAIDSTMMTTAKVQHRQLAEYVALEALNTYTRTPGPFVTKLNAAKARAQEISSLNLLIGTRLSGLTSGPTDIQTNRPVDPIGAHGTLTPGIWWYREPPAVCDPNDPCPCVCAPAGPFNCGVAGAWSKQFFQPVDLDTYPTCRVNAFEAALRTDNASSVPMIFMKWTGVAAGQNFSSVSVAATYPRHGVFLVDLSRASHSESHIPYESTGGPGQATYFKQASEYTFRLQNDNCATYNPPTSGCTAKNSCTIAGGIQPDMYQAIWYTDNTLYPATDTFSFIESIARAGGEPVTKHFKADYQCFDINYNDSRHATNPTSSSYLVDMYRNPAITNWHAEGYLGPEPLSTMLRGVNYGYTLMAGAGDPIPGDQLGLIGFDESASVAERTFVMSQPSDPIYLDAQNITDVVANPACLTNGGQTADWCRVQNHFFITRDTSGSNIPEALRVAHAQLQAAATNQPAQNFVMLLSNGLTNCDLGRNCSSVEAGFAASYADVGNVINSLYVPDEIALHYIGLGDMTGSHTLVVPSPTHLDSSNNSTTCMTEQEANNYNPPLFFTDYTGGYIAGAGLAGTFGRASINFSGAFSAGNTVKSRGTRYFAPNQLYEFVRDTGGYWNAIRNPCSVDGMGNGIDISPTIKAACVGQTFSQAGGRPTALNVPPYTDGFGRLMCDPQGLSRDAQVRNAVDKVLGRSPYIIVQ